MEAHLRHPALLRELMRALRIPKDQRREFRRLLNEMVRSGEIVRIKGNRYGLPSKMNLIPGRLQGHPEGYGFVIPDTPGQADIYVARRNMVDAMHGDHVVARVESYRPQKAGSGTPRREGRIIRVLDRGTDRVIGRFDWSRNREFGFVVPTDRRNWFDLYVAFDQTGGARDGDLVVAEIVRYPTPHRNPEGRVETIIGRAYDPKVDTQMVMAEFGLPMDFPDPATAASRKLPSRVAPGMVRGFRDLRGLKTVTIDGEKARDFDDAVSIERAPGGRYRLWVHIANVSYYVPWNSALDLEARRRGTSVYFPDRVVPMFPENLSNGICSLNPREDRLALTVEMLFDSWGKPVEYDLYESVIKSDERMTYTAVGRILEQDDPELSRRYQPLVSDFRQMGELAERLRSRRMGAGSIDFDLPEPEIVLDLQGQPLDIIREERNVAHRIIEEFMLAANRTVAGHMADLGVPFIYRIHEPPDPDRLADLSLFVASFGHVLKLRHPAGESGGPFRPRVLQALLERVKGNPEERLINHVVLRSMKQARYSTENAGHFGLAADTYTHFTSPIRRYPDLIVHRLVKEVLKKKKMSASRAEELAGPLAEIARTSSERERVAMEAEREVVDLKKVRFMEDKMGEEFFGFITGVTSFGFFVELEAFFVEGLVHITSIPDDYYVFLEKEHSLLGRHHRRRFRIADRVRVRVENVNLEKRQIDFSLTEDFGGRGSAGFERRKSRKRRGR
jgi:ribonuclease R